MKMAKLSSFLLSTQIFAAVLGLAMEEMMNSILQGKSTLEKSNDIDLMEWFKRNAACNDGKSMVSTNFRCQTSYATHLCIYAPVTKLTCNTEQMYSIGGTYHRDKQQFWFLYTTSLCHGNNYLLNLYVIPRKDMRFSIFLPGRGHNIKKQRKLFGADNCTEITERVKEHIYPSSKKNEVLFIKTYCFTKAQVEKLGNLVLLFPCAIRIYSSFRIHPSIFTNIKLKYTAQLNKALYRTRSEGDFIVESATGKKYPMHIYIAAHSPVLNKVIKDNKKTFTIDHTDEDVKILIKFLYNGTVDKLSPKIAPKILELAHCLELPGMIKLGQATLSVNIKMDNAVQVAILAKKYDLKQLLTRAFHCIKQNPDLLLSDSIKCLDDIDLMREILQYVGNPGCTCKHKLKMDLEIDT